MYRNILQETKLQKLLSTRIGDLGDYFQRVFLAKTVSRRKYFLRVPGNIDVEWIQNIGYMIRGQEYKPAIFILGVMPRSGTNYLADLLKRHSGIAAHPHRFWEFPLLSITENVDELQNDFARIYRRNAEVLKPYEFAAFLNSGLLKFLQETSGPNKTMLFKFPYVHYLELFRMFFPRDYLILLLRDGRDVVASSVKTFGGGLTSSSFTEYCKEWDYATRCILRYHSSDARRSTNSMIVKYEQMFSLTEETILKILSRNDLDRNRFDFSGLLEQPLRGSSSMAERDSGRVHWAPVKRSRDFNPLGRWKGWSKRKKRLFKKIAGSSLIAAGYVADDSW